MVKILHCADLHFDAPYYLSDPRETERRRTEQKKIFEEVINYVADNGIQMLLIAGDLFDENNIARETASLILREFAKIPDCYIFIAPGDSDPYHAKSPYKQLRWPDNVHIFSTNELERVEVVKLGVDVYGYAFQSRTQTICPLTNRRVVNKDKINIGIGHGDTTMQDNKTCPISKADIDFSGLDYLALGHKHNPSGILQFTTTTFAYSGCLEGHSFDEPGYKGVIAGTVDKGSCDLKGVKFSKLRYESLELDITSCSDPASLSKLIEAAGKEYGDDTALRLTLSGKTVLDIDTDELAKLITTTYFTEVVDETLIGYDLAALRADKTVVGVFYRKMEEMLLNAKDDQKIMIVKAMRAGLYELMK